MTRSTSRRNFLKTTSAGLAAPLILPGLGRGAAVSDRAGIFKGNKKLGTSVQECRTVAGTKRFEIAVFVSNFFQPGRPGLWIEPR